ncbi:NAD-dependent epimerase/dehydratase family protein [Kribbella sp.]|uniref:NAD-dependent epimerase/dehydratase family protein n=1 Tax=Kribbella sp. TaxID=1871183 RepID=UPI0039C941F6
MGSWGGGVTVCVGDVYDRQRLGELVGAARPEVVVHQLTDLGARDFAANSRIRREGTRNLVDAALAAGVRRVVSQSIAWAYEPGLAPADEGTPLDVHAADEGRRTTVEAVATLEAITAEAPEWVVLRYGMLYGPGTWYTTGGLMASSQLPYGPDVTSFLHVADAAEAAVAALTWPSGPVNIVDDEPLPASTWAPAFARAVGAPPPTPSTPTPTRTRGPAAPPTPTPAPSAGPPPTPPSSNPSLNPPSRVERLPPSSPSRGFRRDLAAGFHDPVGAKGSDPALRGGGERTGPGRGAARGGAGAGASSRTGGQRPGAGAGA